MTVMIETPPRTCARCGGVFYRRPGTSTVAWAKRTYCGKDCTIAAAAEASHAKSVARRDELIEDLEWIIDTDTITSVARRLGYDHPEALERMLLRVGRHDLAAKVRAASFTPEVAA